MNEPESEEESERVETELVFLYVHGFAKKDPRRAGAGVVALNKNGEMMFSIRDWFGPRTSTHAEYKSLVIGLDFLLRYWAVQKLIVRSNSGLLVKQVRGGLKVRDKELLDLKH